MALIAGQPRTKLTTDQTRVLWLAISAAAVRPQQSAGVDMMPTSAAMPITVY